MAIIEVKIKIYVCCECKRAEQKTRTEIKKH